jgi:hypothetical protein
MSYRGRWTEPTDRTARDEYRNLRRELKLSRTAKARRTEIENRLDEISSIGSKEPSSQIREPKPDTADNLALVARVEAARKPVPAVFPVFNLDPAAGRQRAIERAETATLAEKAVAILADLPNHPLNRLAAEVAHWLWSEDRSNPKAPAATLAAQYIRHWLSDEPWNRHDVRGSRLTVDAAVANAFRLVAEQEATEPGWFVRRAETLFDAPPAETKLEAPSQTIQPVKTKPIPTSAQPEPKNATVAGPVEKRDATASLQPEPEPTLSPVERAGMDIAQRVNLIFQTDSFLRDLAQVNFELNEKIRAALASELLRVGHVQGSFAAALYNSLRQEYKVFRLPERRF